MKAKKNMQWLLMQIIWLNADDHKMSPYSKSAFPSNSQRQAEINNTAVLHILEGFMKMVSLLVERYRFVSSKHAKCHRGHGEEITAVE